MDKETIKRELEKLKRDIKITENRINIFDEECEKTKSEIAKSNNDFFFKNKTDSIIFRIEELENSCVKIIDELGQLKKDING